MRKLCCGLLLGFVLIGCNACVGPEAIALPAIEANWKVIGPRYVEYVNGDARLTDQDKADRVKTAELMSRVIAEARKPR